MYNGNYYLSFVQLIEHVWLLFEGVFPLKFEVKFLSEESNSTAYFKVIW